MSVERLLVVHQNVLLSSWAHNYISQPPLQVGVVIDCRLYHGTWADVKNAVSRPNPLKSLLWELSMIFLPWFTGLSMPSKTLGTTAESAKPPSAWVHDDCVEKTLCRDLNWAGSLLSSSHEATKILGSLWNCRLANPYNTTVPFLRSWHLWGRWSQQ